MRPRLFILFILLIFLLTGLRAQIDFRITAANLYDENGERVNDDNVLVQLINLGPDGLFDPVFAGEWTSGDDFVVDLQYDVGANVFSEYPSSGGLDLAEGAGEAGRFLRRFLLEEGSPVAVPGAPVGIRWYPGLSPNTFFAGTKPADDQAYGEVTIQNTAIVSGNFTTWTLPSPGGFGLTAFFHPAFTPDAEEVDHFEPLAGFSGIAGHRVLENTEWPEEELVPNDLEFFRQNAVQRLGLGVLWDFVPKLPGPVVAILDTGIDRSHTDLKDQLWRNPLEVPDNGQDDDQNGYVDDVSGWDFLDGDGDPDDLTGHGTHLAGIIAGRRNNRLGIAGVAPDASLLILKVGSNPFPEQRVVAALDYVTELKERGENIVVVNNSYRVLSSLPPWADSDLKAAFERAAAAGLWIVTAAGNDQRNNDLNGSGLQPSYNYPTDYPVDRILSVGGTDANGLLWKNSSFGAESIDLLLPAENILSTAPGQDYERLSGTSQSAALLTGALALAFTVDPELSEARLMEVLRQAIPPAPQLSGLTRLGGELQFNQLRYALAYDHWKADSFGLDYPVRDQSKDLRDPDRDGLVNLLEFALGSNPLQTSGKVGHWWQVYWNGDNLALRFALNKEFRRFQPRLQMLSSFSEGWKDVTGDARTRYYLGETDGRQSALFEYRIPLSSIDGNGLFRLHFDPGGGD